MMFYAPQPASPHQFMAPEAVQSSFLVNPMRMPTAPLAVGVAPSFGAAPYQPTYFNPTMINSGPSAGYYTLQPTVVKRHNPYAPVGSTSSATILTPAPASFHDEAAYEAMSPCMAPQQTEFSFSNDMASEMHGAQGGAGKYNNTQQQQLLVSTEELMMHRGNLAELSRTAPGSSFIQAALRDGTIFTQQNVALISAELLPAAGTLLLDAHGCYVVKTLMERMSPEQLQRFVRSVTSDPQLIYSMCTHSLHTRRVVQFLMDSVDVIPVAEVLVQRCLEVSMTQQGCIIMQRAMDVTPEPLKAQLFSTIFDHLLEFSVDPFANYVVQHMLEIGDKELVSSAVLRAFRGNIVRLACNKFASNVMEKSLFHITPDAQHDMLHDLYEADEEVLLSMLQDSFGNYLIQSSIALASFKDVAYINERLKSVLQRTPYGHKIELRIERRLKGRPVGTRSSQIGANSKSSRQQRSSRDAAEPSEEPW